MHESTTGPTDGGVQLTAPPEASRAEARVVAGAASRIRRLALSPTALPLAVALTYVIVATVVAQQFGPPRIGAWEWRRAYLPLAAYGFIVAVAWARLRRRPDALRPALRAAPAALALQLAATAVMAAFMEYKVVMQQVQPFWADALLVRADWIVHFGRHAWQLIPLHAGVTVFLDGFYLSFFAILFIGLTGWAWFGSGQERARFFLAYFLCWIVLGTVLATLLSSAGPVYLERLGISDAYAPLMNHLHRFDLEVINSQEALWLGYTGQVLPGGISAMPSLHVAIPALLTLSAWRWPWLRGLGVLCTALTLIATVHLGWHYALDGYVSIVAVAVLWWFSGVLMRWWTAPAAPVDGR